MPPKPREAFSERIYAGSANKLGFKILGYFLDPPVFAMGGQP